MRSFDHDTIHRLATKLARLWAVGSYLEAKELPTRLTLWAYPRGVVALDWGAADAEGPLHNQRIRIDLTIERQAEL